MQYKYWGYADYFCEPKFGSAFRMSMDAQITKGAAAQSAFYNYDFFESDHPLGDMLKPSARRRVLKVANISLFSTTPIAVQGTGDEARDAMRRSAVLEAVAAVAGEISPDQIIIVDRIRHDVSAEEGMSSHEKMLGTSPSRTNRGSGVGPGLPSFGSPRGGGAPQE